MLKKIVIAVIAVILCGGSLFAQELKIGKVNSEAIYQGYPRFRQAEDKLQREAKGWQTDRTKWEADMERLQNAILEKETSFKSGQAMFTDAKRKQALGEIDSLRTDFYTRTQQRQTYEQERYQRRRMELLQEVLEEVNLVITKLGETENYDFIVDAANGSIVYAKNPDELTEQVLHILQSQK